MRLDGAVAIVTGAGRGIGAATARALVERGARVVAVDLEPGDLKALSEETGADAFPADVRDPDHAVAVVEHAVATYGRLDVVVANAGIGHAGDFADMPSQRIADLVAVNTTAPMLLARAAVPALLKSGSGAVVFVSSIAGTLLVPRESVYSATKAAVDAFAEMLREEMRGHGITVSTVAPTVVATSFFTTRGEPYARKFPRPMTAEKVARVVVTAAEHGAHRYVVPRWLAIPMRLRHVAPASYRRLARRFGG